MAHPHWQPRGCGTCLASALVGNNPGCRCRVAWSERGAGWLGWTMVPVRGDSVRAQYWQPASPMRVHYRCQVACLWHGAGARWCQCRVVLVPGGSVRAWYWCLMSWSECSASTRWCRCQEPWVEHSAGAGRLSWSVVLLPNGANTRRLGRTWYCSPVTETERGADVQLDHGDGARWLGQSAVPMPGGAGAGRHRTMIGAGSSARSQGQTTVLPSVQIMVLVPGGLARLWCRCQCGRVGGREGCLAMCRARVTV